MRNPRSRQEPSTQTTVDESGPSTVENAGESKEVVEVSSRWTDDALRAISSFDAAMELSAQTHGKVLLADEELGSGFVVLETSQKRELCGLPLFLMAWHFYEGEKTGKEFVAIQAVQRRRDGSTGKYIVNDGSTGIYRQLRELTDRTGRTGALLVKKGLRESVYDTDEDGNPTTDPELKVGKASTFYLDTSA